MNIFFLKPYLLWFLPICLIPVILHLFFQKHPKHIIFSDVRFIQMALKNILPKTKLKQLLLLIIRCLILFLLILTSARPISYSNYIGKNNKVKQIIIMLDVSYSMLYSDTGIPRIKEAKNFVKQLISELLKNKNNIQIAILVYSKHIEKFTPKFSSEISYLQGFIDTVNPTYNTTDLINSLSFAYKFFIEQPSGDRTIIIISDVAKHIIQGLDRIEIKNKIPEFDEKINLIFVNLNTKENNNTYIRTINISLEKTDAVMNLNLINYQNIRKNWCLSVELNNKEIFNELININKNVQLDYEVKVPLQDNEKEISGKVKLKQDNLKIDDEYYFVIRNLKEKKILVVDGDYSNTINSESYYLVKAMNSLKKNYNIKVISDMSDEFIKEKLLKYDIIFLCNLDKIPENKISELKNFLNTNKEKGIILTAGDKINSEEYQKWLSNVFVKEVTDNFHITDIDRTIFSDSDKFELDKLIFNKIYILNSDDSKILIKLNNGYPLLIQKIFENNSLFIFASTIDSLWTNFVSKPFYPYFIEKLINYIVNENTEKSQDNFIIGDTVFYTFKDNVETINLISPDNTVKTFKLNTQTIKFSADMPGIYKLVINYRDTVKETKLFAVNVDREKEEGNLEMLTQNELKRIFGKTKFVVMDYNKDIFKEITMNIEGKNLSKFFIILIILFTCAGILLSKKM